jgi:hypothetical protein
LIKEFLEHYHEERPHQTLDNLPPRIERAANVELGDDPIPISKINANTVRWIAQKLF